MRRTRGCESGGDDVPGRIAQGGAHGESQEQSRRQGHGDVDGIAAEHQAQRQSIDCKAGEDDVGEPSGG